MKTIYLNSLGHFDRQLILHQLFRAGALLSGIAALVCLCATTQAAPPWSPPVTLSYPAVNAGSPEVAISENGLMVASWVRQEGSIYQVQASVNTNGNWRPPFNLSQNGQSAFESSVAIAGNGVATAVWSVGDTIQTSTFTLSQKGGWSTPVALSNIGISASSPKVVVDAVGNAIAMWIRYDMNGVPGIETAYRQAGGNWSAPVLLAPGAPKDLMLVVNPSGEAAAIWSAFVSNASVYVSTFSPTRRNGWSAPYNLAPPAYRQGGAKIGIAANGNITACWRSNTEIRVAQKPADGNWSAPQTIYANRAVSDYPTLAVTPSGDAMAAWITYVSVGGSYNYQISSAICAAGGTWSAPVFLTGSGEHDMEMHAGTTTAGACVLTWVDVNSSFLKSATWDAKKGWYDFATIESGSDTALAVGGNTALAIWMTGSSQATVSTSPISP